ncbi:serine/threonine protein phosphatase [Intrasporangium oryzae NRRL B-24470]|uniref:Serine/threonine protein phosphatase n=1 Tax=Intrasporangium oryzae NRRL B-24470 TaxID=1386089 RepID=W9G6L5_9MICO|nr:PP2C family protein-serine/threonine phosphatase [Intrasporangium oryzae]EWT00453.1 serine/threonine protein phosphatase [Intrasporangium oryzae NRRL B-24470]
MAIIETIAARRSRGVAGPIRRLRLLAPSFSRAPWLIVTGFLLLAGLASLAIIHWPLQVPWGVFTFLCVAAGLFLEPRPLLVVFVGMFLAMSFLGAYLGSAKPATIGAEAVTLATMGLMFWLASARAQVGVIGVSGESMLVDMRDRLRAQGELPELPPSWCAETALESAYGDGFAGDFVVASRSTDGRTLEVAIVDVSGKGRTAGTRSLLLSGALGGLLGELSEHGFLASANNHLLRLRWPEGFASAVHVAINLETGDFSIGYAGHPAAAQFAAGSGRWKMLSGGRGPLLGVIENAEFPRQYGTIRRGDAIVLYSDGVIEARDRTLVDGIDRMLGRAESFVTTGFEGLAQRLCDHAAAGHGDDRAVVTIWRR